MADHLPLKSRTGRESARQSSVRASSLTIKSLNCSPRTLNLHTLANQNNQRGLAALMS